MSEDTIKRRARGLDRAFDILDFLKEIGQPLRPNDIANGIGSPKSTVYELVASLLERRILEPVGKDGHVYLGRQLYFLGQAHLRHFDLSREADHALQEIVSQTHETAQMCLLNGRKYTVALMKEGERHFRISSDIGENAPIPWTASGRLLLGHLSDQQIIDLIDHDDFILPDGQRLPLDTFLAQIRQAKIQLYEGLDQADTLWEQLQAVMGIMRVLMTSALLNHTLYRLIPPLRRITLVRLIIPRALAEGWKRLGRP